MSGPRWGSRAEWRFQCRHQLRASGAPEGGFGPGGAGARTVTLGELTNLHDEEFVRNAYRQLLRREPDPGGFGAALARLRSGDISKIDLLGSLRYSEEGRAAGVEAPGLRRAHLMNCLFRLPVLGYLARTLEVLLNLPRVVRNMERFEAFTNARLSGVHDAQRVRNGTAHALQAAESERLWTRLEGMERRVREMANLLYLSAEERGGAGITPLPQPHPAAVDAAIDDLRATVLGRASSMAPGDQPALGVQALQLVREFENMRDALASVEGRLTDLGKLQTDLQARAAEEAGERETLGLEVRGLIRQTETDLTRLRASFREESEQLGRRLEAEIKVREALGEEVRQSTVVLREDTQRLAAQLATETAAREDLGNRADNEFAKRGEFDKRFAELEKMAHQLRKDLTYSDWRIASFVAETRKRFPDVLEKAQIQHVVEEYDRHRLDPLYASFEDAFRGSREDIKARQAIYLSYIKEANAGSPKSPVVDLGCGRGEWLELLQEQELEACGVDSNRVMVDRCVALGLSAELSDVHTFLGTLKDNSIGCVTGFHIVEHMPFDVLISLVDEVLRVLRPGGIVIFETPNPRNLLVGSTEFFNDPTHLRPLPPHVLKFLAEARGFCGVEVLELHPFPEGYHFEDDGKGMTQRLNEYFFGPQDYSIIGRKV